MPLVTSGVEHGNLRELALARMKDLGTQVVGQPCQLCTNDHVYLVDVVYGLPINYVHCT